MSVKRSIYIIALISMWANIALSQGSGYSFRIDNDLFNLPNQTDRFYTSGVSIEAYHPVFTKSPLSHILISDGEHSNRLSGFNINQDIFTPSTTRSNQLLLGDRPYASTLLISQLQVATNQVQHYRITSSFGIGLIGKYSGGEKLQNLVHGATVHSESALGWENQIATDLLLDYKIGIEKGLVNSNVIQINAIGDVEVGTLYNRADLGAAIYLGYFEDYFENPMSISGKAAFSVRVFSQFRFQYVGYDATLQGGIFNTNSGYVIAAADMKHGRFQNTLGLEFSIKSFAAQIGRIWQTPEFSGMPNHAWGFLKFSWLVN